MCVLPSWYRVTKLTLPLVDKSAVGEEDLGHLVVQVEVKTLGMSPETLQVVQGISSKRSKGVREGERGRG